MIPEHWFLWGLAWFFLPRMAVGLIIVLFFPQFYTVGLVLAIIGGIIDICPR